MNKPELSAPIIFPHGYTADQMKAYGQACIEYGRAQGRAELIAELKPVAWTYALSKDEPVPIMTSSKKGAMMARRGGCHVQALAVIPEK